MSAETHARVAVLIFCLAVILAGFHNLAVRVTALEQAAPRDSFNGFLYVLNDSGTWDRIRANQMDICRTRRCSVIAVGGGERTPQPQSKP